MQFLAEEGFRQEPTTAHLPLKYKVCKGQVWFVQGPKVAVAAAHLEHIVPDVTHPTKWETTAHWVYVPMGSPGPAISTNPPDLSMEVPAAPNQSADAKIDVAGYHLRRALFAPVPAAQLEM